MEHQTQLVSKVKGHHEQSQASLVQELSKAWKPTDGTPPPLGEPLVRSPWSPLMKLELNDAYLQAFEWMAEAACWHKDQ